MVRISSNIVYTRCIRIQSILMVNLKVRALSLGMRIGQAGLAYDMSGQGRLFS